MKISLLMFDWNLNNSLSFSVLISFMYICNLDLSFALSAVFMQNMK